MPKQLQKCLKLPPMEVPTVPYVCERRFASQLRSSHLLKTTRLLFLLSHPFPSLVNQWEVTGSLIH